MRKKLFKVVALLLAGVMTLAGCGNTDTEQPSGNVEETNTTETEETAAEAGTNENVGPTTLEMAWWGNQVRNERTQEALNLFSEENPEVAINAQFFQWGDYWSKLATMAAGKKLPDIIQMDYSYIDQYVEKEQLLDISSYIESGAIDVSNVPEDIVNMGKIGDGIYGIPCGLGSNALIYNKTVLEEAGVELKDNSTLGEFIEVAKQVAEKTGYKANLVSSVHGVDTDAWSRSKGLQIVDKSVPGDAESFVGYFEIMEKGIADGWHVSPEKVIDSASVEQSPLVYGSSPEMMTWCTINAASMLTSYQSAAAEGTEIALTTVPTDDPTRSNYVKPSMFFSVSANCTNVEESVELLNFMLNSKDAYTIMLGERGIPISSEISEHMLPLLSEQDQMVMKYVNEVLMPNSSPVGPASPEGTNEVIDLCNKLEEKVGYGEYTAQQAAEEYFTKGNEIFAGK